MKYKALAHPGKIGNLTIKNRIVMAPLNNNYTHKGFLTEESVDFYVARAKGGVGLVIIEATSIDYPRSRSVLNPSIDHDRYIPAFAKIAGGCHRYDSKVFVQLSHVGRQTRRSTTGMDPVGPSAIKSNSLQYPDTPKELTIDEIQEIVQKFTDGAVRAKTAGLDGVELIFAHGYLANNFLTPNSNLRTDEYGELSGGVRFCKEIIESIKRTCGPNFPVIARINGNDYIKAKGNTIVEASLIAQQLENAGCDCVNVSAGMRDSELSFNDHTSGTPRGSWIHLAEHIKRVVSIPVIAVKRFDADLAEKTLVEGKADFIAFGKQSIADSDFAEKILLDRTEDIIPCTSCCQGCYDVLWMKLPITCMVNPSVGRPVDYLAERSMRQGNKRILVVGGGPAGCEFALEAAKKGHQVTLIEKETELGGNYGTCKYTNLKKEVSDIFGYVERQFKHFHVDVKLNTAFSDTLIDEIGAQIVVDATGADFIFPEKIKGIDSPIVLDPISAIDGSKPIGDYVAVISCSYNCTWTCRTISHPIPDDVTGLSTSESHACAAGHAAADVAEELAGRGKKVVILTGRDNFVPGMGFTNRGNMLKRFFPKEISISNNVKVKEILTDGVLCEKSGMEFKVYADTVVMSVGMKPRQTIKEMLSHRHDIEFVQIGDVKEVGNAFTAFRTAYELVDKF